MDMLNVNWARVKTISENKLNLDGDVPLWNDRRFGALLFTEIHNYLSAAYTFQETFETVIQKLPSGELTESKFQEFKNKTKVVIGLRTYAQHEQMFSIHHPPDLEADDYRIGLKAKLEEVWTLNSQITEDHPHGYNEPPEKIYGDLEGEFIDILSQFEAHLRACEELVELTFQFAEEEIGEELDEIM